MFGKLYIVATPIGNLDDITKRAIDVLSSVNYVFAEDTRRTLQLYKALQISSIPKIYSMHAHNEVNAANGLLGLLNSGHDIALVSDAGTPLVSDPGYELMQLVVAANITVIPVPGVSALTTLMSVSSVPVSSIRFYGFLPAKKLARRKFLSGIATATESLCFYESCHRILETLTDLLEILGEDRLCTVGREMTKKHEEIMHGTLAEIVDSMKHREIHKGEFALIVSGIKIQAKSELVNLEEVDANKLVDVIRMLDLLKAHMGLSDAAKIVGKFYNLPKKMLFDLATSQNNHCN